jgi:hypothetical protein
MIAAIFLLRRVGSKAGADSRDNECESAVKDVTAGWRNVVRRKRGKVKDRA